MMIENALNDFPILFIMQQITCQQTFLLLDDVEFSDTTELSKGV